MRLFLTTGLVVLLTAGCAPAAERTEVLRVPGPDGTLDAVVEQTSAGATSPFGYVLTLPASGCPAGSDPVLRVVGASRSATASGVRVAWTGPRTVRVSWLDARFRDPDQDVITADADGGPVTVLSGGGETDPGAPPGAMPPSGGPTRDC